MRNKLIAKIREIEERAKQGTINTCEFEREIDDLFIKSKCPQCQHIHENNSQCETILFDGLHLMTECQCIRTD